MLAVPEIISYAINTIFTFHRIDHRRKQKYLTK